MCQLTELFPDLYNKKTNTNDATLVITPDSVHKSNSSASNGPHLKTANINGSDSNDSDKKKEGKNA